MPPDEFIPVFEHNGFISTLDRYMWEHVCRTLKAWADAGRKAQPVSVNISRIDLYNPHLAEELKELVDQYGVPAQQLNLEITESAFTDHAVALQPIVEQLHRYGFCVMMDDFGSGYSSLNVLKDVDVDVLKIDMKFLSGESNGRSLAIIESIVRMAREIGLSVVAEGVETSQQASLLRFMGCDYAQGYLYPRPIPEAEYEEKWMQTAD